MASGAYAAGKVALWKGLALHSATIKAICIDTADYTVALDTHDNLDDVAAGARVSSAVTITSPTVTVSTTFAVFDAADTTFTSVSGDQFEAVIIYYHTGVESTSTLLFYIDGLSVTPDGGNILCQWNASGICKY